MSPDKIAEGRPNAKVSIIDKYYDENDVKNDYKYEIKKKMLESLIKKNDDFFDVKNSDIDIIIAKLCIYDAFDNKQLREEIFPDYICGFLDRHSAEIYKLCKTRKKQKVAKFVGKRLDTPEKVFDMHVNWNDDDNIKEPIMCILWAMEDQIQSMANCIKYFDDLNEDLGVLKKIWDIWNEDSSNELNYSRLHTKLLQLIPQSKLDKIHGVFIGHAMREQQNTNRVVVRTGDYKLCKVEKLVRYEVIVSQNMDPKPYWMCKILSQPGNKNFNLDIPVNIEESCFEIPQAMEHNYNELREFDNLHHVRLGSWNVACINGPDIPTNQSEYETKFKNITDVIFKSGCDIVALQELPNELKIKKENGSEETYSFDPHIKETITGKLAAHSNSIWEIQYSQVHHTMDSISPGERLDSRKNRKEIYAFVYNTSVVKYLHPDQTKTNKVEDRRSLGVRLARCPIISNFCSNKLEFTLCTVHLPPSDKKIKTYAEIQDLGEKVFPEIKSTFGEKKAKSVIFLGDFNMGYTQKKKLLPRPTVDTWDTFYNAGYVPCIKATTNVLQNMHYDNIWMHQTMEELIVTRAGGNDTGVVKVNEIEGTPFVIGSSLAEGFKKRVSDHNLVFVDLRNNEVMPWSSSNVILKREN